MLGGLRCSLVNASDFSAPLPAAKDHQRSCITYPALPKASVRPLAKHRELPVHVRKDLVQLGRVPSDVALVLAGGNPSSDVTAHSAATANGPD